MGPTKEVIINGKKVKILEILNFWLSFTIQHPQNRLIDRKCIQNKSKKGVDENKLCIFSKPKYNLKFSPKSYPVKKKRYNK